MTTMKLTRTRLFVAILVLIFLYYAIMRLHMHTWSQTSMLDKQGFRVNLDVKLPLDLQYKYGNLSKGECRPGYAAAKMTSIYPAFVQLAPMFLDQNFRKYKMISDYSPPFGIKTVEKLIDGILSETKTFGLGVEYDRLNCKKCIIVGNGGILTKKILGYKIDEYDVVIRLNQAPIKGFEKHVGNKTTMRITYPEGAIQKIEHYEKSSLFILSAFKSLDLKWLRHMVTKERLKGPPPHQLAKKGVEGFWKSVAHNVPREAPDIRILNPYFIQEAAFKFIGFPSYNGQMGRGNIPTLGTVAVTMALHNCDEVDVAGFSYDLNNPKGLLHYYETQKMSAIKESWTHDIYKEKEFLRKLVKAEVIKDLTEGI